MLIYTRICDIHLSVPCTRLANVSVGYPTMHKAQVFLYVYNSTLWCLLPALHRVCNALEAQNDQSEVKLYIYECASNPILVSDERGENALLKKAKSTFFIILGKFSCKSTTHKMFRQL